MTPICSHISIAILAASDTKRLEIKYEPIFELHNLVELINIDVSASLTALFGLGIAAAALAEC